MYKDVRKLAKKNKICKEWHNEMKGADLEELCDMFFKGSDWATANDFPSLKLLRKYKESERYGLFIDRIVDVENVERLAFFGDSKPFLKYNQYSVGEIYIRHNTRAKINAKDNAMVFVYLYDSSNVEISVEENAKVVVFKYGNGNVKGATKVINKKL